MATTIQEKYWRLLEDQKISTRYYYLYSNKLEKTDRLVEMIITISSSGSIASWAVWQEFPMLWASIIVGGQFLMTIKSYLPFKSRLKALSAIRKGLSSVVIKTENNWFEVSNGSMTEAEINELLTQQRELFLSILSEGLENVTLPDDDKLIRKAEQDIGLYFKAHY